MTFNDLIAAAKTPRITKHTTVDGREYEHVHHYAFTTLADGTDISCNLIPAQGRTRRMRDHYRKHFKVNGRVVPEAEARAAFEEAGR